MDFVPRHTNLKANPKSPSRNTSNTNQMVRVKTLLTTK